MELKLLWLLSVLYVVALMTARHARGDTVEHVDEAMTNRRRDDVEAFQQCSMISHVQNTVIQILNNHYEFETGIKLLNDNVDDVKRDISRIKDEVNEIIKKQSSLETNALPDENSENAQDWTSYRDGQNRQEPSRYVRDSYNATSLSLGRNPGSLYTIVSNLTAKVDSQENKIEEMGRKYKALRRTVRRALEDDGVTTPAATTTPSTVRREVENQRMMVEQMLNKQRDINAHLEQRMNELEARLQVATRQIEQGAARSSATNQHRHHHGYDCPDNFIRYFSSCYRFVNRSANWVDAEKRCQAIHHRAHLVSIESKEEADFLVKYRLHNRATWTSHYVWTGGNDLVGEGQWKWVATGAPVTFTLWKRGEPNNHNRNQHCMYFYSNAYDHSWDDWNCRSARLNFICEIMLSHEA